MSNLSFRQVAYVLNGTYSASSMAKTEGLHWPPPPTISLRKMLSFFNTHPPSMPGPPRVRAIDPGDETGGHPGDLGSRYYEIPTSLADGNDEGRVAPSLRSVAQLRDGKKILEFVAKQYANSMAPGTAPISQEMLTAMTELAVTGSNAFAAWSKTQTSDLTAHLTSLGMPAAAAATVNKQIMADFNAALQAVRNPAAGISERLRRDKWIAVAGEDDPPDYPVNVEIAPYPQYHHSMIVDGINVNIRYVIASQQKQGSAPAAPCIPPGDEVIIYIHGEGSRAEEADDFIHALFSAAAAAGRSFTVIAFDQPSCGYSTMVPHLSVAPMPPTPVVDLSPFAGSPILDFVEKAIVTFVETLVLPFGNPIAAVIGGSLGGHMVLRLAASQKEWVNTVVAWSPACVMEHDATLLGISLAHTVLSNAKLGGRATAPEPSGSRHEFFKTVWDDKTFGFTDLEEAAAVAGSSFVLLSVVPLAAPVVAAAIMSLPQVPPQPEMWYRSDWPLKKLYIDQARHDRQEVYNTDFRQWHWRICMEMLGFRFDTLASKINRPLLLMVGSEDDFPMVHFRPYVVQFGASLTGLVPTLVVLRTGHSIHNERPKFLADQILQFVPPS